MFYQQLKPEDSKNMKNNKANKLGLGLFISKQIVQANGGHIDFVSEHGKGTTFVFTFDTNEASHLNQMQDTTEVASYLREIREDIIGGSMERQPAHNSPRFGKPSQVVTFSNLHDDSRSDNASRASTPARKRGNSRANSGANSRAAGGLDAPRRQNILENTSNDQNNSIQMIDLFEKGSHNFEKSIGEKPGQGQRKENSIVSMQSSFNMIDDNDSPNVSPNLN